MKYIKVLLVEDNCDDKELILRIFKKNNLEKVIFAVNNGAEALDFLFCRGKYIENSFKKQPVLILLDLSLPGITGFEVLKSLRKNDRTYLIPVVILTSSNKSQDIINAYNLRANSYIYKPSDISKFNETLEQLILYWLNLNEPPVLSDKSHS